jgi:hypothetical protein
LGNKLTKPKLMVNVLRLTLRNLHASIDARYRIRIGHLMPTWRAGKMETAESTERALIDIFFARAELTSAKDAEAIARALQHIDSAMAELKPLAPHYETTKSAKAA